MLLPSSDHGAVGAYGMLTLSLGHTLVNTLLSNIYNGSKPGAAQTPRAFCKCVSGAVQSARLGDTHWGKVKDDRGRILRPRVQMQLVTGWLALNVHQVSVRLIVRLEFTTLRFAFQRCRSAFFWWRVSVGNLNGQLWVTIMYHRPNFSFPLDDERQRSKVMSSFNIV